MGSSSSGDGEKQNPEKMILEKIDNFYDENYRSYDVYRNNNFLKERVWNVYFDLNRDLIYVFLSRVRQVSGKKLICFEQRQVKKEAMTYMKLTDSPI